MNESILKKSGVLFAIVTCAALSLIPVSEGWAQEKCKRTGTNLAQDTKYTQQHVIDVGDVPGHQVRILELHYTPSNAKPNCEGLKVVEGWSRGYSDYTSTNGRAWGYAIDVLENGDKIFSQWSGITQTTVNADGSKKATYTGITTYTGGTGKYRGIHGMSRNSTNFNAATGFNESQWEQEYWIDQQ
jgi:hypothetical protein